MAAAPQHNLQSTLSGPGQSRHNVDDRSLTQLFVKTGIHRLRCRVITGNTYLVPAFVHLTAKARHLHRQGANGFRCRVHIQAEAAAKSLQIPVKADACQWR